jgi:hypothetical protein
MSDNKLGAKSADFSLGRFRKQTASREVLSDPSMKKSSYTCPADLQQRVKLLSVRKGLRLNALVIEAFEDLLSKYGE